MNKMSTVCIYTVLCRLCISPVWWIKDENNSECKNVWTISMEILSHSTDMVRCTCLFRLLHLQKGLGFFAVICNQSQKNSAPWLAHRRLLSGHIYAVSHYLPTEKCSSQLQPKALTETA